MREAQSRGIDTSIGGTVAARVEAILAAAGRDVAAIRRDAERDAEATLAAARRDADGLHHRALAEVHAEARRRIEDLNRMRAQIAARGEAVIAGAHAPAVVREQLEALVIALAHAAELVAREAGLPRGTAEPEPDAAAAPEPRPEATVAAGSPTPRWERQRIAAMRLEALREAVAGATREELTGRLEPVLGAQATGTLLDDVFGRPAAARPERYRRLEAV